jgi:hypothetical protein
MTISSENLVCKNLNKHFTCGFSKTICGFDIYTYRYCSKFIPERKIPVINEKDLFVIVEEAKFPCCNCYYYNEDKNNCNINKEPTNNSFCSTFTLEEF